MNKVSYGFMNFITLLKVVSVHVPYKVYVSDTYKKNKLCIARMYTCKILCTIHMYVRLLSLGFSIVSGGGSTSFYERAENID